MGATKWKRPESVPFPSTWATFKGKNTGRQYWVQDVTDDYVEQILDHLCTDFLMDEPLSKYSNAIKDQQSVAEMREIWKECLSQKLGLMCLTKGDDGENVLVGFNATCKVSKDDPKFKCSGESTRRVIEMMDYLYSLKDPYSTCNIDSYLGALGLLILPGFRGEAIGLEILKAREPLCRAVGIKTSFTAFTSIISQKLAAKAGFKDFVEITYDELEKINPFFSFPGITSFTKSLKFMYIMYD